MNMKTFAVFSALDLTAVQLLDLNLLLNAVMLAVAAIVAWPIMRQRRNAQTIRDLELERDAAMKRRDGALEDLKGAEKRADLAEEAARHLRTEAAAWQARYEEQQKYTAKGAVTHLEEMLIEHQQQFTAHQTQVAERHERMLAALDALTEKIIGGQPGGGQL